MAIQSAKYEAIHDKTGADLTAIKANFDNGKHLDAIDFPVESAIMYQICLLYTSPSPRDS